MFTFAILVLGSSGIIAQILLIREFMITFSGNELSIGIILANWLILEAVGSYLAGHLISRIRWRIGLFAVLTVIFSFSFPAVVYLIRVIKSAITPVPGEGMSLFAISYLSFFILIPISLLHGALFTIACRIYADLKNLKVLAAGKVYIWETIGTIGGGVVLTFLLIPSLPSFRITLVIVIINLLAVTLILYKRRIVFLPVILTVGTFVFFFSSTTRQVEQESIRKRFFNQSVLFYQDSYYGNVAVTRMGEQNTFYVNGVPIFTTPYPDIAFVEEYVHLPLLFQKRPEDILILSGGAGGIISEFLKYDLRSIDYLELDPLLVKAIRSFPDSLTRAEIRSPLVSIKNQDGRLYLTQTKKVFDVVQIGLSAPSDLQVNRLFTIEFFRLVKARLKPDGMLVIHLPGSLTYLSSDLKRINVCIINTLKEVFGHVYVIPGDYNIILASKAIPFSSYQIDDLITVFKKRDLPLRLISEGHIRYRMSRYRQEWFEKEIRGFKVPVNQDFHPMAMLYTIEYWTAARAPFTQVVLKGFEGIGENLIWIIGLLAALVLLLNLGFRSVGRRGSITGAIFATGFSGLIFQLVLIFGFQVLYGFVYYMISILITAMMAGIASGAITATRRLEKRDGGFDNFLVLDLCVALFGVLLIGIIMALKAVHLPSLFSEAIFVCISFVSGILIGAQFPIANKLMLEGKGGVARTVGSLYAADLLGGWVGGMFGGVILLPILGLIQTLVIVIIIKILTVALLYRNR